jgi:hypothetical protein
MAAGIEVLGATLGGIAVLPPAIKLVLDVVETFSIAWHAIDSAKDLSIQFDLERLRFLVWCNTSGFLDYFAEELSGAEASYPLLLRSVPEHYRRFVSDLIADTIQNLAEKLEKSETLFSQYTYDSSSSYTKRLQAARKAQEKEPFHHLELIATLEDRPEEVRISGIQKAKWAVKDRKPFERLLDDFRTTNNTLERLCSTLEIQKMGRQVSALVTTIPLAHSFADMTMEADLETSVKAVSSREARDFARLSRRQTSDRLERSTNFNVLHLNKLQITFPYGSPPNSHRSFAKLGEQSVLVEWRYYSRSASENEIAALNARVHLLSVQMQQSHGMQGFHLLRCVGHFNDFKEMRHGLVFEYPADATNNPISLLEWLKQDSRQRKRRDLEDRWQMAQQLVKTLYSLFTVGWLHKNISSENILVFRDPQIEHSIGDIYLCGFDLSRPDHPDELTEFLPSRLHESHQSFERAIYKHPESSAAQSSKKMKNEALRYRMEYDAHSLGMILIEIGCWCPLKRLVRDFSRQSGDPADMNRILQHVREEHVPELRYRMGRAYAEVVDACISGQVSKLGGAAPDKPQQRRIFLEDFDAVVVEKLDQYLVHSIT